MSFPRYPRKLNRTAGKGRARESLKREVDLLLKGEKSPSGRIGLFDGDGVLWKGDLGQSFFQYLIFHDLICSPTEFSSRSKVVIEEDLLPLLEDTNGHVLQAYAGRITRGSETSRHWKKYRRECSINLSQAFANLCLHHAGQNVKDLENLSRIFFDVFFLPSLQQPILWIIRRFHQKGGGCYVASGSAEWLVRSGARHYGIPPSRVLGNSLRKGKSSKYLKKPVLPSTWEEGKLQRYLAKNRRLPLLSAGDSAGDLWILQASRGMSLVVNPLDLSWFGAGKKVDPHRDLELKSQLYQWRVLNIP